MLDLSILAHKETGYTIGRRNAQANINALRDRYTKISEAAGLREQLERAAVGGFRRVKARNELADKERFAGSTFINDDALNKHVKKHIHEYGDISAEEYTRIASELLQSPANDDIMEVRRSDGGVSKYRISTNDFVASDGKWSIRTLFKPKNGIEYWRVEIDRNR